ncbi:MAG: hypothetical protein ACE5G2_00210 [Candidatus Krumholzibacteriia bacterium]
MKGAVGARQTRGVVRGAAGPRPAGTPGPAVRRTRPETTAGRGLGIQRIVLAVLTIVLVLLVWGGLPYYELDKAARVRSPWHDQLKPTGSVGLSYGYIGTAFLLLLLAYSVRKRVGFLRRLGTMPRWLSVHVVCGLAGPGFITLHAGFRFHGAIAVGYWSMICVMLSGCVGFYLYRQIPRALSRTAGEREGMRAQFDALDRELVYRYGLTAAHLEELRRIAGVHRAEHMGMFRSLLFIVTQDLTLGFSLLRLRIRYRQMRRLGRDERRRLRSLVRRRVLLERRRAFLRNSERLFSYWHAFHRPFAIMLYTTMALHIGIAVWMGYAW